MSHRGFLRLLLACCLAAGYAAQAFESSSTVPSTGTIEYAFTPGGDAAGLIVRTIDEARSQVLVLAFTFTHHDIAAALIRAHQRGIDVQVIADREQSAAFESAAMRALVGAGIPVFTDAEHGAAHNKVVIVDQASAHPAVATGSFNFTFAAQNRNAENVLVMRDNPDLAHAFFGTWQQHREHALGMGRSNPR